MKIEFKKYSEGYAAITTTFLVIVVSLSIVSGLSFFSLKEVAINRSYTKSVESKYVSESGVEDMVYRILSGKQTGSPQVLSVGNGSTTVTIISNGNQRIVRSEGKRDSNQQNLEARVDLSVLEVSFNYGAQVGDGGIEFSNNARIAGSVYSNGNIIGEAGATITGNTYAAGTSQINDMTIGGNAQANLIDDSAVTGYASSTTKFDDVIVGKDAHANELDDSTVTGNAFYQITDANSIVLGTRYTGNPGPPNLPPLSMPIADSVIGGWKNDAAAGGVINGNYSVTNNISLGPRKITGNLLLTSNNKTLTVTGTIYVQGSIDISNGSAIKCNASYGETSCIVMADGWIHLSNNGQFSGSGTPGSFLMLLSTAAGSGHHGSAIDLHNNALGAIFYAGSGMIYLHNNVIVTNLVADKIILQNGAEIIYDTSLSNVDFGGGGGSYDVKYWKEVE